MSGAFKDWQHQRSSGLTLPAMLRTQLSALALSLLCTASYAQALPPSVSLPPELDRVLRDYEKAWTAKDLQALAALFSEQGMALPNGRPPAQGREAIAAAYAQGAGTPLALRAISFAQSGELAYVVGTYAPAVGAPDIGKFVLVLRRGGDGQWKLLADMDNANARRGAVPAASASRPGG